MDSLLALQELVRINSQTLSAGETAASHHLAERMAGMGLETYQQEAEPGRLNAVGTWRGSGGGKSLMFNGHVDTNPVTEGWTVDPWSGVVRDGYIFGIGVSNMKAGCMAYLQAVEELRKDGYHPRGDVVLTYVVGELQNGIGTRSLMDSGLRTDYFVNCEPTDLQALTAHAGAVNFEIELFGSTRHVSKRQEGVDALLAASELVPRLDSLQFTGVIADEHQRMIRCHVGVLHAALGRALNESRPPQVADYARVLGTARFAPGQTLQSVLDDIEVALSESRARFPGLRTELQRFQTRPNQPYFQPFCVQENSTVVQALNSSWRVVRGMSQPTGVIEPCCYFGSDAAHLQAAGIEGVVCGPGGKFNTMPDERVDVGDYMDAIEIYKRVIVELCS